MQETFQESRDRAGEEEREERIRLHSQPARLWFERLASKLRVPAWLGIGIVGLVPAIALWSLGIEIRIATDFTGVTVVSLPLLILNVVFLTGSSRLISRRAERLREYTTSLGTKLGPGKLGSLYSLRPVVPVWAVLLAASALVFDPLIFRLFYPPYQSLLRILVTSYLRLMQATFLWVLGYSMYSIYKWGKLPLKLKSFTEDRTLGLKPYGTTSLFFVTLYVVGVLVTFPIAVYVGEAVLASQSIFFLLGVLIFLGPLLGLRRKLLEAKQEKLEWIGTRHSRVMEQVEAFGDTPLNAAIVGELAAVDTIRRDIQQIHTWPFNSGILAKMVTVVMLPLLVAMIATYLIHILQL